MSRRPRPRTLGIVCACLVLLAAGVVTGVHWAHDRGSVTLLANWSSAEEKAFQEVIDRFEKDKGIEVIYEGSSALSQVLAADIASGTPPDVAMVPGPGELLAYAAQGRLHRLDALFDADQYDDFWTPRLRPQGGLEGTYWLPVKASLKSMVWYSGIRRDQVAESAGTPRNWCLAMGSGATSGWPGTDWVEDILLQQTDAKTYRKWVDGSLAWTHDSVRAAWTTFGDLVGAGDLARVERALKDDFDNACAQRLEHQGSFRAAHWQQRPGGARYVHSADVFPESAAGNRWEVSGDLAVMLNPTDEAKEWIRYLADPGTPLPGHTVNTAATSPHDGNSTEGRIGATLRAPDETLCWDASDAMPRATRDAFHQAVLRYLLSPRTLDAELAALERRRVVPQSTPGLPPGTPQLPVCS
ncbi:ABC transporter substrate-binding protein [Streptomyces geranii]|uniref:ABC transporter substrate-binding protein n=1 Tax=Streptomyces geranii TaxID=2058923 RepID=UPI000D047302|nr:extracellular solute-binding protein [Streptomyces geranii]